jgi:hypothetical protein
MKLEFLDDISGDGKFRQVVSDRLIRLYDFDFSEANQLRHKINTEILQGNRALDLSTIDFIENVNCTLVFTISKEDEGLTSKDKIHFHCVLTIASYRRMIQLMEPFCTPGAAGHQWLYEQEYEMDLLFSPGGRW